MATVPAAERLILPGALANTRDCGGLPTDDGRVLRTRRLLRTASLARPHCPLDELVRVIGDADYVDLRTDPEIERDGGLEGLVDRGWRWHRSPLRDVPQDPAGAAPAGRPGLLPLLLAAADRVTGLLGDRPVVVGCSLGKDRTGLVTALVLHRLGVRRAAIVEDFELSNACLRAGRHLLPERWRDPAHGFGAVHAAVCSTVLDAAGAPGAGQPPPRFPEIRNSLLVGESQHAAT